jgi:IclR helix-turn-helix domain
MKLDLDAVDHAAATPLAAVHDVFQKWLGPTYDFQALDAVLATAAAEALPGDPPWLNVIAGPGWAKTETVAALEGAGARIVSTIVSDAALLSASIPTDKAKEKNPTPTGGLLKLLSAQARKILVLKDLTSVLSMDRTARAKVLAALREIYDGAWDRNVGSDGGRSIAWRGRIVLIGACTDDWDRHHEVVAKMGDRFVLVRMQTHQAARAQSRTQVRTNSGHEGEMRAALRDAVAGLFARLDRERDQGLTESEWDTIGAVADLVTRLRTAVERDYSGNVLSAYEAEAPTRFQKQLAMLFRGAVVLGIPRPEALTLVCRVGRDCLPRDRVAVLEYVRRRGGLVTASEVADALGRVKMTVRRLLEALAELGFLRRTGDDVEGAWPPPVVRYVLHGDIDLSTLDSFLVTEK